MMEDGCQSGGQTKRSPEERGEKLQEPSSKRKRLTQQSLHSFFSGSSSPNSGPAQRTKVNPVHPAKAFGIRVYNTAEMAQAKGHERNFREFWNAKAAELCNSPSSRMRLRDKGAIQGAIHTAWTLHKTSLWLLEVDELVARATQAYPEREVLERKLGSVRKNRLRMTEITDNISMLYRQVEVAGHSGTQALQTQLHAEMGELRKAHEALRKAVNRQKVEIDLTLLQEEAMIMESVPSPPTLSLIETQAIVESVNNT